MRWVHVQGADSIVGWPVYFYIREYLHSSESNSDI